ncbi:MAG TPA: type II secretion system protein [Kiritimatiellia bacterium]|nr:type II secretion system protein [Kiritimatiellia bacterium]
MLFVRKTGFTLIELLVVISILGILAAALTTQVGRARSMGQAIRCKTNLRNLAQASLSYAVETKHMPWAGSFQVRYPSRDGNRYVPKYYEHRGWVGWVGSGSWPNKDIQDMEISCFHGNNAYYSLTNGSLWTFVGKDVSTFLCDTHKKAAARTGLEKIHRSYVMNAYFGYEHKAPPETADVRCWLESLSSSGNAASRLLFAELPARSIVSSGEGADSVLQAEIKNYANPGSPEMIGFNHKVGKRYVAHVAYADGHVDALIEPEGGNKDDCIELTRQLCNGEDITEELRDRMR